MTDLTRRSFLIVAGAATAGPVLAGRGAGAATPTGTALAYDYPTALAPPFAHGVASGDPLADRVILWTRLTLDDPRRNGSIAVRWRVATDPDMSDVVAFGVVRTHAGRDWTVKVDAFLPEPATTYYYRFDALGTRSVTGRTRTAPAGDVDELRFAVVACSSYWSAHFNGYARLAERDDLDLVLHCGDHIYDFPDEDEWVRARNDRFDPEDVDFRPWRNKEEARRRYALYYADPDFLRLHQQHPIAILWDNHDIDPAEIRQETLEAFWEWTPTRPPRADGSGAFAPRTDGQVDPEDIRLVYRQLSYGTMADVVLMDTRLVGKESDDVAVEERRLLGDRQFEFLSGALTDSKRAGHRWRVLVNGWPLGQLKLSNTPGGGGVPFYGAWDDYPFERDRLLGHLRSGGIDDNVVVTGDAHGNFAWDLVEDPTPPSYDPTTGGGTLGSVGVEFAPSSLGRGGADETIAGAAYRTRYGHPPYGDRENYEPLLEAGRTGAIGFEQALRDGNPNLRYIQWRDHGYGIVHLTPTEAVLEHWWQPILVRSDTDVLGQQHRVAAGTNHVVPATAPTATSGRRRAEPAPDALVVAVDEGPRTLRTPRTPRRPRG